MFKYFFACPKERLVARGKLILEALGEASVALRDCRLDTAQCMVTDQQASGLLGPGTVIDPFPGDRSTPSVVFGVTKENHAHWKWIAFESGLFTPSGERVQALIGYEPNMAFTPERIRRRRMIQGKEIFSGENEFAWTIPIARSPWMTYGHLSTYWVPQPGARMQRKLDKEDEWLWNLSGEVQDFLLWIPASEESRPEWDDPWSSEKAMELLAVNYRLGRPEMAVLDAIAGKVLTDIFVIQTLHAVVGDAHWGEWLAELQKKTSPVTSPAPAGSKSGSGEQEECRDDSVVAS